MERDHTAYDADVTELPGHPDFGEELAAPQERLDTADAANAESLQREAEELGLPIPKVPL